MPLISEEYDPAEYDDYDITGIPEEAVMDYTTQVMNDYDEPTAQALCVGIRDLCKEFFE